MTGKPHGSMTIPGPSDGDECVIAWGLIRGRAYIIARLDRTPIALQLFAPSTPNAS
jgi:hypothetical protein